MNWREHIARSGAITLPGEPWVRRTFWLLLVVGAVLRFWNFTQIPYTHDEISTLVRIYPSLAETVQRGVIELDTHPPGVQVFEWAWTSLFGMSEPVVKLPFLLMGLASLFLLFRFAQAWTSASAALVSMALLATLQYTVMYSQIARPYAAGLFTTALLADQLTRFIAFGHRRALLGIGAAAVLSAYTHHFAMLLAALMVVSGFFLLRKEQRRSYLLMAAIAVVLYLPNVPIFFIQLGQGGLSEWLAPPDRWWLLDYAWWLAHCSWLFAIAIGTVLAIALGSRIAKGGTPGPARWVLLAWGAIPLIIGLAYSVLRAPVIQYSVVLFSFPYLLLLLLMGLGELKQRSTLVICAALVCISVFSLVRSRHHYELFYHSKYEAIVRGAMQEIGSNDPHRASALIDAPDEVVQFYMRQWAISPALFPYVQLRGRSPSVNLDSLLRTLAGGTVFVGLSNGAPSELVGHVQARFPHLLERNDYLEGQTFLFTDRTTSTEIQDRLQIAVALPAGTDGGAWDIHADLPTIGPDSVSWNLEGREYGIGVTLELDSMFSDPEDLFEVTAAVSGFGSKANIAVVLELIHGDSTVFYRTGELKDPLTAARTVPLMVAARRADTKSPGPIRLKAYIHNRDRSPLLLHRFEVMRREANPIQYGLVAPILQLGRFHK